MYPIPDGGIMQIVFTGKVLNQQMVTVLHYQWDAPGGSPDGHSVLETAVDQIAGAMDLHAMYLNCISNEYTQARVKGQWILPERHAYYEKLPVNVQGLVNSPIMGPNLSVVINKRSEVAGVHGRGTTHMPGVPASFVTSGTVNVLGFGNYNGVANMMATDIVLLGGTLHPVIYNRTTPGDSAIITNSVVSQDVRTMHRRTVGLGS